ncbi:unnamed protein product [Prunus brigantina]
MWASILISRDLPYGLMVNKGSNYHCGGELYYPAAAGYQLGFIQSIPIPPMDSVNLLSSWRVEFKDAKEVTTLTDFNQDLVKSFSIPIRDPRFADNAEKENPPADVIERESPAKSTGANSGLGKKRPNAPIQGDSPAGNILPSQTFLRPRKVPRNLSPQGSPRPADHPSSSHSVGAVQSATISSAAPETQTPALEKEIGAQIMTSVGEDESAEITTTEHSEDVSTWSHEITPMPDDHAHEHVAELTEEDFPHIPSSQADVVESIAITVDHAIVTNGVPSTIPTDGSAHILLPWWSMLFRPDSSLRLASLHPLCPPRLPWIHRRRMEEAWPWSPMRRPIYHPLIRDLVSLEDKDERDKLKAAIDTLASSGFFPDPRSAAMISYLFSQVEKFAPRPRSLLEEQRMGHNLEQRITSCSAIMRREVEIACQMQQEAAEFDEQVRQLQERKAGIVAKVSEIIQSNRPLEAQLRQDAAAVGAYRERKLTIQSTLSVGDTAVESFRTALRTLFPDA